MVLLAHERHTMYPRDRQAQCAAVLAYISSGNVSEYMHSDETQVSYTIY
jgi:hypothetical protein